MRAGSSRIVYNESMDTSPARTPPRTQRRLRTPWLDQTPHARHLPQSRRSIAGEIWIVLGLSLGQSAVYALVSIIARLTAETALRDQAATLNTSQSPRPWLDLTYQVLSVAFALVPVALALYLLARSGRNPWRTIGLDARRPARDLATGVGLAALIGIPGLGLYLAGRALGVTVDVQASTLNLLWWTIPVLVLKALMNALLEEVIVVGYLSERLSDLGWPAGRLILGTALLRGSYHLYQGIGPFVGNVLMGLVFTGFYLSRWGRRRVLPLVVAHTLLDIVSFVGYQFAPHAWLQALGLV